MAIAQDATKPLVGIDQEPQFARKPLVGIDQGPQDAKNSWSGSTKSLKMRKTPGRDRPRASIPRFLCRVFGCAGQRATLILASQPPTSTGGIWSTPSSLPPLYQPIPRLPPRLGGKPGGRSLSGPYWGKTRGGVTHGVAMEKQGGLGYVATSRTARRASRPREQHRDACTVQDAPDGHRRAEITGTQSSCKSASRARSGHSSWPIPAEPFSITCRDPVVG